MIFYKTTYILRACLLISLSQCSSAMDQHEKVFGNYVSDDERSFGSDDSLSCDSNFEPKRKPWTPLHFAVNRIAVQDVSHIVTHPNFNPKIKKYSHGKTPLDLAIKGMRNENYHKTTRAQYKKIVDILFTHGLHRTNYYELIQTKTANNKD